MKSLSEVIKERSGGGPVFAKHEFQAFGLYLAQELDDLKHKALYIKLAKEEERAKLWRALEFVKARSPKSKARLFMWKVKKLREN
ncbi:MAG: hypothetical protein ABH814_01380 [bacterium]